MNAPPFKPGTMGAFLAMTPEQRRADIDKFWDALDRAGGNISAMDPLNGVPTLAEDDAADFREHLRNHEFLPDELNSRRRGDL